jgi:hypothetical protein
MKANRELEDLHQLMCDLADYLATPKGLRSLLDAESQKPDAPDVYKPGADLIQVVSDDDDDPLSAASADQPESRKWRYDEFGRRLVPPTPPAAPQGGRHPRQSFKCRFIQVNEEWLHLYGLYIAKIDINAPKVQNISFRRLAHGKVLHSRGKDDSGVLH